MDTESTDSGPPDEELLQPAEAAGVPGTYLPIREIGTAPGMSQTSDQAIRDDYRWLPDTQANLSLLTPAGAIPAGFTQASP
jgi:hypothetical protein